MVSTFCCVCVDSEGVVFWMVWMVCDYYEDVEGSYFSLLCWKEINQTFRGVLISLFYWLLGITGSEREFYVDFLDGIY